MQAEKILLGQMLMDNRIAIDVSLNGDEFTSIENKTIFDTIKSCLDDGIEADIISVSMKVNGVDTHKIAALTTGIGSAANWRFYQEEIKKNYTKKRLLILADNIKNGITDHTPGDMIGEIEKEITDITKDMSNKNTYSFKESMPSFIDELQRRYDMKGELPGISTGLKRLDDYILGFQNKFLYYIGARPSGGKSAMLLNMTI